MPVTIHRPNNIISLEKQAANVPADWEDLIIPQTNSVYKHLLILNSMNATVLLKFSGGNEMFVPSGINMALDNEEESGWITSPIQWKQSVSQPTDGYFYIWCY